MKDYSYKDVRVKLTEWIGKKVNIDTRFLTVSDLDLRSIDLVDNSIIVINGNIELPLNQPDRIKIYKNFIQAEWVDYSDGLAEVDDMIIVELVNTKGVDKLCV